MENKVNTDYGYKVGSQYSNNASASSQRADNEAIFNTPGSNNANNTKDTAIVNDILDEEDEKVISEYEKFAQEQINNNAKRKSYDRDVNNILNELYLNRTAIKAIDIDGDGRLNDYEKMFFEKFASSYCKNNDELSLEGLKEVRKSIYNGKFSYSAVIDRYYEKNGVQNNSEVNKDTTAKIDYDIKKQYFSNALMNDTNFTDDFKIRTNNCLAQIEQVQNEMSTQINELNDLYSQISNIQDTIENYNSQILSLQGEISVLTHDYTDIDEIQISYLEGQVDITKGLIEAQKGNIDILMGEISKKNAAIEANMGKMEGLNSEKTNIENEINSKGNDTTKAKLSAYNEAQKLIESINNEYLSQINQLNNNINQTESSNSINNTNNVFKSESFNTEDVQLISNSDFQGVFKNSRMKDGVFKDKGTYIEDLCEKYDIDPYLVCAIMAQESGWGTTDSVVYSNNPGGYMDANTNYQTVKYFNTLDEGIEAVIKNLSNNYIKQGLTTIQSIGNKYCPIGVGNDPYGLNKYWVGNVTDFYNELTGKNVDKDTILA